MRITKPVSFNLDDPHQKRLYDFVMQQGSFSGYVKDLIWLQLNAKTERVPDPPQEVNESAMKGFL